VTAPVRPVGQHIHQSTKAGSALEDWFSTRRHIDTSMAATDVGGGSIYALNVTICVKAECRTCACACHWAHDHCMIVVNVSSITLLAIAPSSLWHSLNHMVTCITCHCRLPLASVVEHVSFVPSDHTKSIIHMHLSIPLTAGAAPH
jgi:hypothetical protein